MVCVFLEICPFHLGDLIGLWCFWYFLRVLFIIVTFSNVLLSSFLFLSFFLFFFWWGGCSCSIWKFPGQGSNRSYNCHSTPQPQKCQIWATSATYTTACGNARSLTHWVGPGIEPEFSWILVRFVSAEPQQQLISFSSWF